MGCPEFHIHTAAGSDKEEEKYKNVHTESVEIKHQHVQAKAISKEQSMFLLSMHLWLFKFYCTFISMHRYSCTLEFWPHKFDDDYIVTLHMARERALSLNLSSVWLKCTVHVKRVHQHGHM